MGILLTLCMALTITPDQRRLRRTHKSESIPGRFKPGIQIKARTVRFIGEFPSGTIVEVIEIKGDWARVRYEGQEYYMWAPRLTKVGAGTTSSNLAEKPFGTAGRLVHHRNPEP